MKVALFEPQIPQNTGNIIRTCSVTATSLLLVEPMGFTLTDKWLKRAGLDYIDEVLIERISNLENYLEEMSTPFYFFSSHATKKYTDVSYTPNDLLIFGSEIEGLPSTFHEKWKEKFLTIPMIPKKRCLNLSNSVAIVLYEALRQQEYAFTCERE